MSLAVVFKSAEGIVLAADSRITLSATRQHGGGGGGNQRIFPFLTIMQPNS